MSITLPEITIVGQLPQSKSRSGHPFSTADQAAIAALDEILPVSIGNDIEYSGAIVQNIGSKAFSFTYAETEDNPTSSNPNPQPPSGTKLIGVYHTHGAANGKNNAENFSFEDMMICRSKGVIFWLGTPSKHIKKLIPPQLLSAAEKQQFGLLGKPITLR